MKFITGILLLCLIACKSEVALIDDEPILWSQSLPSELHISTPGKQLTDNYSLIHEAAYEGDILTVEKLLKEGVSPNLPARWQSTPLHFAAVAGKTKICHLLLNTGAKVNLENKSKDTPLDLAIHIENPNVVKLLLEFGAQKGHRISFQEKENKYFSLSDNTPVSEEEFKIFYNNLSRHQKTCSRSPWSFKPVENFQFENTVDKAHYFTYKKYLYMGYHHRLTFFYPWILWPETEKGKVMSKVYFKGHDLADEYEKPYMKQRLEDLKKRQIEYHQSKEN